MRAGANAVGEEQSADNCSDWTMVMPALNLAKVINFLLLRLAKLANTNI
jgi:hypothetical protein